MTHCRRYVERQRRVRVVGGKKIFEVEGIPGNRRRGRQKRNSRSIRWLVQRDSNSGHGNRMSRRNHFAIDRG